MVAIIHPIPLRELGPDARAHSSELDRAGSDIEALVKSIGSHAATVALMESGIGNYLSSSRSRGYPSRIFISYRHENEQNMKWVRDLASGLTAIGYRVLLDQDHIPSNSSGAQYDTAVASFMQKLATADYVIVIATTGYSHFDGDPNNPNIRSWIFEEYNRIRILAAANLIKCIVVLKDYSEMPFGDDFPNYSAIIDVRGIDDGASEVIRRMPRYEGVTLQQENTDDLAAFALRAINCAKDRDVASCVNQGRLLIDKFGPDATETSEYGLCQAAHFAASGNRNECVRVLASISSSQHFPVAHGAAGAQILFDADFFKETYRLAATVATARSFHLYQMHLYLGYSARTMDQPITALNHFRFCEAMERTTKTDPEYYLLSRQARGMGQKLLQEVAGLWWKFGDEEQTEATLHEAKARYGLDGITLQRIADVYIAQGRSSELEGLLGEVKGFGGEVFINNALIHARRMTRRGKRGLEGGYHSCDFCSTKIPIQAGACLVCGFIYNRVLAGNICLACGLGTVESCDRDRLPNCPTCKRDTMCERLREEAADHIRKSEAVNHVGGLSSIPSEMIVTDIQLTGAQFLEQYKGINIFLLQDGRVFLDGRIALVTVEHAKATIDELSRQGARLPQPE